MFDKPKTCKKCGATVFGNSKICPACGTKIRHPIRTALIVFLCICILSAIFGETPSSVDGDHNATMDPSGQYPTQPSAPLKEEPEMPVHTHTVTSWTTKTEPSCSSEGQKVGTCSACDTEITESISKIAHTDGDWAITKEATPTSEGEKSLLCKTCGCVISTISYALTEDAYKQLCQTYSYKEIARYPDTYDGKQAQFTGEVIQVMENSFLGDITYTLRVDVTPTSYGYTDTIYVTYDAPEGAARLLEYDIVTMYGTLRGTVTYETILGASVTIPSFDAAYITIQE